MMKRPPTYVEQVCPHCQYPVRAIKAFIRRVHGQHVARCAQATPEERTAFAASGEWPKAKRPKETRDGVGH
jgi:hypothetical protein